MRFKAMCAMRRTIRNIERKLGFKKNEQRRFNRMLTIAVNWESATADQKQLYYNYLVGKRG